MVITAARLQDIQDKVEAKVAFILSAHENNLDEDSLLQRRTKLTEKYLEEEYEQALSEDLSPPLGKQDEVAQAINC